MKKQFEAHLRKGDLSENTITSYMWTVDYYLSPYWHSVAACYILIAGHFALLILR